MSYTLNGYFNSNIDKGFGSRMIVYPNNTIAARLVNHYKLGENIIRVWECLSNDDTFLPMPDVVMKALDSRIQETDNHVLVVGIDAYLSLLDADGVTAFMSELRQRLDANNLNVSYLLSICNKPHFEPRYEESRKMISIDGDMENLGPVGIHVFPDKWIKAGSICSYRQLLAQMNQYQPSGEYMLVLPGLTGRQAGIGNSVSFVVEPRDIALQYYGLNMDFDDDTLEELLTKSAENNQSAEVYLEMLFGNGNINPRLALKRLVEVSNDNMWLAYIWMLRRRLVGDLYISKVLSEEVSRDNLLRKYVVDCAVSVISDTNAKKYAAERADALKALDSNYESLIIEFVEQTKEFSDALQFLNIGTNAERAEIIRRASLEDLSYRLPREYYELFPALTDYLLFDFDFDDEATTVYFNEYRKLKITNNVTDSFVKRAFNFAVPKNYPARDSVISELCTKSDYALLVVDAMGIEYLPLLIAIAERRGMIVESYKITTAQLPTETKFNHIKWKETSRLCDIKSIDNTVHDGAEKHEHSSQEENFAYILHMFETKIINRIAEGLTRFSKVVVTADHGASRLAVIAHNHGKGKDLPWDGQPDNWRYSRAPQGVTRPAEFEQSYHPENNETYWIVRGYNRLPKSGGKLYELHGGAAAEEMLVPVVVFAKNAALDISKQPSKKSAADLIDEFEGLI